MFAALVMFVPAALMFVLASERAPLTPVVASESAPLMPACAVLFALRTPFAAPLSALLMTPAAFLVSTAPRISPKSEISQVPRWRRHYTKMFRSSKTIPLECRRFVPICGRATSPPASLWSGSR